MNLFEIDEVTKKYGSRTVLDIPELKLRKDRIHAIMGPNGSGKTTLMRILNLLDTPDTGHIKFLGEDLENLQGRHLDVTRRMCMVFQRPFMFHSSVFNNVAYGLKIRKVSRPECEKKVKEVLDFVEMNSFASQLATRLSGGETQRVALARALVLRPELLLLDEPTANLDPSSVKHIEEIIRNWHQQYNTSVIIVTHNLFQAKRLADESILLINGKVVEKGKTHDFFNNPQAEESKQFLDGTMVY
ncbi:MAG: ATP-binding cassette domain-containing protein [Syntrophomonadaceae bacterium]|nr:ATP-binding cassette domain-containing protein [Syntrophomonadaceae bacterium]MDD3022276.1 ATP-binding cassette domain-containing protein [Syntrophomonadaceae bacterium]